MKRFMLLATILSLVSTPGLQASELIDRNNGTVIDKGSGLIWQQEASGRMPWLEAVRFCNQLDLAGMRGWRLPFKDELRTLISPGNDSYIESKAFPGTEAEVYWSLSREEQQPDQVWGVSFADGKDYLFDRKNFNFQARCMIETAEAVYLPLLNKWSQAWSAQDVEKYLACYGQSFAPEKGTREDWAKQRQVRLTKPNKIKVELGEVKVVSEEGSRAEVMFRQSYSSDSYHDQVMKVLTLGLERGELVIVGERTISKIK